MAARRSGRPAFSKGPVAGVYWPSALGGNMRLTPSRRSTPASNLYNPLTVRCLFSGYKLRFMSGQPSTLSVLH